MPDLKNGAQKMNLEIPTEKKKLREKLAADTAAFLKKGGKIKEAKGPFKGVDTGFAALRKRRTNCDIY